MLFFRSLLHGGVVRQFLSPGVSDIADVLPLTQPNTLAFDAVMLRTRQQRAERSGGKVSLFGGILRARSLRVHVAFVVLLATIPALVMMVFLAQQMKPQRLELLAAAAVPALVGLGWAVLLAIGLARSLQALAAHARSVATGSDTPVEPLHSSSITELNELRLGIERAEAVLRRRGAAERVALREARAGQELLASVVNAAAESIYVKDIDLRYVLVNCAALRSGSEPREEWQVLGRCAADIFPQPLATAIEAADAAVLASGRMQSFEHAQIQPDGSERWIWMTITPWQDARGKVVGVVSVTRDVTTERASAVRLRILQADLLRATRLSAMGAMASGLAHELNQPLAAATNYLNAGVRLLERSGPAHDPGIVTAREVVSDGVQQLQRAGDIVRRLRDFVSRGEAELQPEDVGELIREACDLARMDGTAGTIDLRVEVADDIGVAMVDRTQIQQVLVNLIRNAGEAIMSRHEPLMPARQGEIVVSAARQPEGRMWIEVTDNGPGLAPGVADRLFQPFVSTKATGMGIGLSICHTIIEGHGGRLTAETRVDGMMFRITLPALHPLSGAET